MSSFTADLDRVCGFSHRLNCGYVVIEDRCKRTPCPRCDMPLAHGNESTFRGHECPKWWVGLSEEDQMRGRR